MTLLCCTQTFFEIGPCRARPGRAKPGQAGQGRRLGPAPGQPLDLASFRKTVDSFTRNAHFRAGPPKLIVSTTRNDHFQNSIHTSALDDLSPDDPTAPHIFPSGTKTSRLCGEMRCFSGPAKCNEPNPLTKRSTFQCAPLHLAFRAPPDAFPARGTTAQHEPGPARQGPPR
jgi:hypothetical protein